MDVQITQELYTAVDAMLKSSLLDKMSKVMLGIGGLAGTMWTVSFTLRSMRWYWLGLTGIFQDVAMEMLKVAFIAGCAFNIGWYWSTIVPFVTDAPVWMGAILSGNEGSQLNQVDLMIKTYTDTFIELYASMDFSVKDVLMGQLGTGVQTIVMYSIGGIPFLASAVITLFLIKAALTMMLVVGPLYILFALFDPTRQWFYGWVNLVAGLMLTQVLFSISLALQIGIVNALFFKGGEVDVSMSNNIKMLLCFWAFTALSVAIPVYAGSIMSTSVGSAASPGNAARNMASGFKAMANMIGKKGGGGNSIK